MTAAAMLGGAVVGGLLVQRGEVVSSLVLAGAMTLAATTFYVVYPAAD